MIATHSLPEAVFTALAAGSGGPEVIRHLREAQQSKHLMLLQAVAGAAGGSATATSAAAAFRAGYELLTKIQAADPGASAWLLGNAVVGSTSRSRAALSGRLASAAWRTPSPLAR